MSLANQTIAITGASSGIGAALARELAPSAGRLVLIARREDRLRQLAADLDCSVEVEVCDLTHRDQLAGLASRLVDHRLDGLVNNAGVGMSGRFWCRDLERATKLIELNVVALVQLTHAVLPGMVDRGRGFIFNVGSIAGFQGRPYMATYGASKGFVNLFSEALAAELDGSGVSCGVICPGSTHSEFFESGSIPASQVRKVFQSSEAVAQCAVRALRSRQVMAISGWKNVVMMLAERFAPAALRRRVVKRLLRGLSDQHDPPAARDAPNGHSG